MANSFFTEDSEFEFSSSNLHHWHGNFNYCHRSAVIFCSSGTASLSVNLQHYNLCTGSLIWIPQVFLVKLIDASSDFLVQMASFSDALFRSQPGIICINPSSEPSPLPHLFEALMLHHTITVGKSAYAASIIQSISIAVANLSHPHDDASQTTATDRYFTKFISLLHQHSAKQHEVKFYAAELNITPKYLNELTQRKIQFTAKDVISKFLAAQIQHDLLNPELNVKDLAVTYCFSDQSSLGKFFKKETGLSPQNYRDSLSKQ